MTTSLLVALLLAAPRGEARTLDPARSGPGPADMVADLAPAAAPLSLNPSGMVTLGGVAYFAGQDEANGIELWRSDGTASGTRIVRDLRAGPGSSTPSELTAIGGYLYFVADDGQHGVGLWRTDGSATGTELLKAPFRFARPTQMRAAGGRMVFALPGQDLRLRLMVFEPGVGVHVVAKDLNLCAGSLAPQGAQSIAAVELGGVAYYLSGCIDGARLWRTDGTPAGTSLVAQLGSTDAYDPEIVALGAELSLAYNASPSGGGAFWRSDGSGPGTSLVATLGRISRLMPVGARTFFVVDGSLLYASDGTAAGTLFLKDVPGANWLTNHNGMLLASAGLAPGGLWRSDGTGPGTALVAPLQGVNGIRSVGGRALVHATGEGPGAPAGLWSTDGTTAGTDLLAEKPATAGCHAFARPEDQYLCHPGLADLGGVVLFRSSKEPSAGRGELWRSDGTVAGTGLVLASRGGDSTWPSQIVAADERVYFTQDRARLPLGSPRRLYVSDGTPAGTSLVRKWPVVPSPFSPYTIPGDDLDGLTVLGTTALFYLADSPFSGVGPYSLWRSDGSASGTQPIWTGGPAWLTPWRFGRVPPFVWDDHAYFPGLSSPGASTCSLFSTDGSLAPPAPLLELTQTCAEGNYALENTGPQLAGVGSRLFMSSGNYPPERVLWRSESGAPPEQVAEVDVQQVARLGGLLYFIGQHGGLSTRGLWRSDGTEAGTLLVSPLATISTRLTVAGGALFFVALDGAQERGTLWVSDGTPDGTHPVLPGGPLDAESLTAVGSTLVFSAWTPAAGRELWRSDGTAAGTLLIADLMPGPSGSLLEGTTFTALSDRVYFTADAPNLGRELWSSDGTPAGTQLVQDIAPGPDSSNPDEPTLAGSRLFFRADDGSHGAELWALPVSPVGAPLAASSALPRSAQSRRAADEAEALDVLRRIGAAANSYALANSAFPTNLTCLGRPESCGGSGYLGPWPAGTPAWLPGELAAQVPCPVCTVGWTFERAGYLFSYDAAVNIGAGSHDSGYQTFTLTATAWILGVTGDRNFTIDQSGRICQQPVSAGPFPGDGQANPPGCSEI